MFLLNHWPKILLIVLVAAALTLYLTYLLQSGRVVFTTSESEARGEPEEGGREEEGEGSPPEAASNPASSGSFYDWWLCTIGKGVCQIGEDAQDPRRR